ncbi:MAG TPA: hypothetical protein VFX59_26655 [Polyangiales bacterium]|nr:hypothetical protein [Polyangiales bacterium]
MRIKMTDGAEGTRLPSWRPPQVAQLTAEAKPVATVVVSEQTRALAATLTRSLSDIVSLRLQDLLTQEDRLLIAWATEFAKAEGVELDEVGKLTSDLARYRAQELVGARPDLMVENLRYAVDTVMLSLPRFTPREEAQARAILFGLATTQSTLDTGFVSALLDPDVRREGGVSLGFVQRIVAALPPGKSESLAGLDVVFARRDARVTLATTLERLALPAADLGRPSLERVELGDLILRERARLVTPQSAYQLLTTTTRNERALLGLLYVSQEERGADLRQVDDVARALVALRSAGQPRASMPVPEAPRAVASPIHLAAKAAVAYRSVAPPRPNSIPPPAGAVQLAPPSLRPDAPIPTAVFNLAQALGLSSLVAEAHTQALRARRRRFVRRRDESIQGAAGVRENQPEAHDEDLRDARRAARWRRLLRRRRSRQ